jgi:molecular chaperone DnaK (HSP70)
MSGESSAGAPGARHAIGISFGNSNSSIAITGSDDKAEVIANEDGGKSASNFNRSVRQLIVVQIVKYLQSYLTSTARNTMANKPSNN